MKICLVGPGLKPIPPSGWGAVESLVWDYYETLKQKGVPVEICNHSTPTEMVRYINANHFSIVHIMYDDHIHLARYIKTESTHILYTSHFAYITDPEFAIKWKGYYDRIFMEVVQSQHLLSAVHALSDDILERYCDNGMARDKIKVLSNGAREDKFTYHKEPMKKYKSVYLAKIEMRKRQYLYQTIPSIDFVGNHQDSSFDMRLPNYLGEWSKYILYQNLSHYGNLVLLSDGEADPLVVKEALICGLGLVLSECSAANIDRSKKFITIIPDGRLGDIPFVESEILKNREVSVKMREEIREYGINHFSWNHIIDKYITMINSLPR